MQRHELDRLAVGVEHFRRRGETAADRVVQPERGDRRRTDAQNLLVVGQFGLQPGPQDGIRSPEGLRGHAWRAGLGSAQQAKHVFRQIAVDRQHGAGHLHDPAHRDDARGDDVPGHQRLRGGALADPDGITAAHQIAGQKALARPDVADFMESS